MKRPEGRAPLAAMGLLVLFATFSTFAQVNLNIGTLLPGEKITVTFDATINPPPANTFAVSNQALLTATGVVLNSDDPDTALLNDPTITPLTVAPQITSCPPSLTTNTAPGLCNRPVAFAAVANGGATPPVITYKLGAVNIASPYSFEPGTNVVSVTASNGVLPNATCSFTVIVRDLEPPTMFCPADIITNTVGSCPVIVFFSASATENCAFTNLTATPGTGFAFPVGTNIVTTVAQDSSGNSNGCTFKVIVLSTPTPAPLLNIVASLPNVVLSWTNLGCYQLQYTPELVTPPASNAWTLHPGPFIPSGGNLYVTNAIGATNRFFRLIR